MGTREKDSAKRDGLRLIMFLVAKRMELVDRIVLENVVVIVSATVAMSFVNI